MKFGKFEIDGFVLIIALVLLSSAFYTFVKALPQIVTALQPCG